MKQSLLFCFLLFTLAGRSQDKWDLKRCVVYAMQNNISVLQADVQARLSLLEVKLREAGRYPNLNFTTNGGYNFGRSVNPATNQFENTSIFFNNIQAQSSVNLFNWFSQRYAVEASRLNKQAADAATDKARNDIALNVATAYLQALLASEQTEVTLIQIGQTTARLQNIQKQVEAGALPQLNALEMEAQLARDSAAYFNNVATYQQQLIFLKALLNLDMRVDFDIEKPNVALIPVDPVEELQPSMVYDAALKNQPLQRVNELRYRAALKDIQVAKASMYPTISAFANVGSRYSSLFPDQTAYQYTPTGKFDTLGIVQGITGSNIGVALRPNYTVKTTNVSYGRQVFDVNLGQAIGLAVSVPIFNNRQLRTARDRAVLNAENIKLQSQADSLKLQNDIYTAYTSAMNSRQQYVAAKKAVDAAEKTFDFSQKRFDAGLLPLVELITNQNNLNRSRVDALSAQFEYVFRMKVLEFYKGRGLRL